MNKRVSFYTFGCRLNQAETAIIQQSFEKQGYQIVDFKQPSDMVVVNTCTVTENGDADTRRLVNKINREQPFAQIALIGCQAQIQRETLLQLPNVKWIVGNSRKMDFVSVLEENQEVKSPRVVTPVIRKQQFTHPVAGIDRKHTRANLKVQDGCDFFCSFCVIPYARGRARSREFNDILSEARQLAEAGHRELVLTGINVGTYQDGSKTIRDVVEELENLDGLDRLRISSIEPTTIPDELIERSNGNSKLCRYFHIPLQSGSNKILKAMNRRYTKEDFVEFVRFVDQTIPDVCQGTDVIVGFPGETEEDFEETYKLLLDLPLVYFHVFSYSERPWAKSKKLENKVPKEIIDQRSQKLRELSARKRRVYMERHIGEIETVLFEQEKRGYWIGLTDTYIRVKVRSENDLKNQMLPVKLEKLDNQTMIGILL